MENPRADAAEHSLPRRRSGCARCGPGTWLVREIPAHAWRSNAGNPRLRALRRCRAGLPARARTAPRRGVFLEKRAARSVRRHDARRRASHFSCAPSAAPIAHRRLPRPALDLPLSSVFGIERAGLPARVAGDHRRRAPGLLGGSLQSRSRHPPPAFGEVESGGILRSGANRLTGNGMRGCATRSRASTSAMDRRPLPPPAGRIHDAVHKRVLAPFSSRRRTR